MSLRHTKALRRVRLKAAARAAKADYCLRRAIDDAQHIYVGLAADYGNLGDLAITVAQVDLLRSLYPNAVVVPIPISRTLGAISTLRKAIRPGDVISLVGGGNTGDVYDDIQYLREQFISSFPSNEIVSFPQSIEFTDSIYGRWAARRASRVYNAHPRLTVLTRDSVSLERGRQLFSECRVELAPDVVLTTRPGLEAPARRGVLVALRSDQEQRLTESEHRGILEVASEFGPLHQRDTHLGQVRLRLDEARGQLTAAWRDWASSSLVLTDRLHGMIFAAITETPCIALDSANGKVGNFYRDWLQSVPWVRYMEEPDLDRIRSSAIDLLSSHDLAFAWAPYQTRARDVLVTALAGLLP